jgi:hypothetical protein
MPEETIARTCGCQADHSLPGWPAVNLCQEARRIQGRRKDAWKREEEAQRELRRIRDELDTLNEEWAAHHGAEPLVSSEGE